MNLRAFDAVSIIMPAYNEAETIGTTLEQLKPLVNVYGFEVVVVNDASTDNTAGVITDFSYVKLVNQPYNKGYGAALKTGVRNATNDWVLTMDSDGQHLPEEIPKLLEFMDEFDMVVGSRDGDDKDVWIRKPGKWILGWVANYLSNMKIPDVNSGFRLIRKSYVEEFIHILPNSFSFSTTITLAVIKGGYNVKYVPITVRRRSGGKSRVRQINDGLTTILLIIRCISLFNPLKIYAPIGGSLLFFGIIFSIYGVCFYGSFPKSGIAIFLAGLLILLFGVLSDQVAAIRRGKN
jgi:glycosyltransferase involved in cell wall biosynthesis